jgi:hypothetical protein
MTLTKERLREEQLAALGAFAEIWMNREKIHQTYGPRPTMGPLREMIGGQFKMPDTRKAKRASRRNITKARTDFATLVLKAIEALKNEANNLELQRAAMRQEEEEPSMHNKPEYSS